MSTYDYYRSTPCVLVALKRALVHLLCLVNPSVLRVKVAQVMECIEYCDMLWFQCLLEVFQYALVYLLCVAIPTLDRKHVSDIH